MNCKQQIQNSWEWCTADLLGTCKAQFINMQQQQLQQLWSSHQRDILWACESVSASWYVSFGSQNTYCFSKSWPRTPLKFTSKPTPPDLHFLVLSCIEPSSLLCSWAEHQPWKPSSLPAPPSWDPQTPPRRLSQMGTAEAPKSSAGWRVPPLSSAGVSQSRALCVPVYHEKWD